MTTTTDTTYDYAQTLRRISNAIDALKPYWHDKDNVPPALRGSSQNSDNKAR